METEKNFVITRISELMNERGWSIYRLAKESRISYSSLNNIFVRNTIPSVFTLKKICDGLNVSMSYFFYEKSSDTSVSDFLSDDECNLIKDYRLLTKDEQLLLRTYMSGLLKKKP